MQPEQTLPASYRLWVLLHGPLVVYRRLQDESWVPVKWGQGKMTKSVFRRLLAAPGRRLSRGNLVDDVWSENEDAADGTSIYTVISLIRAAIGKDLITTYETGYEIAGQAAVWVDLDAAENLLKEAEDQGYTSLAALPLLEEALSYLERGPYLEGETGRWRYPFQAKSEELLKQCRFWLAESYEEHHKLLQASLQYRALLHTLPPDERALQLWITMLLRHGRMTEALKCYQDVKAFIEAQGFGLSPLIEQTLNEQFHSTDPAFHLPKTLFTGTMDVEQANTLRRFAQVLMKPPQLEETLFQYLEVCTEQLWRNRQSAVLSSQALYAPVNAHLQKITTLLEKPLLPTERTRLCSLLSQTAQLLGELSLDMSLYAQGKAFHQAALVAAQEAENHFLAGVSWGRISLASIYSKEIPDAFIAVQQAQGLAKKHATPMIQGWLAAIEAEIQANLAYPDRCLEALDAAERFDGRLSSPLEDYLVRFDRSLLGGYQGVSYRLLSQPGQPQSSFFLQKAHDSLKEAVVSLHPLFLQRKPTLLADLALVAIQRQDIEEACELISQAIALATQMQLQKVIKRLIYMQEILAPWKDTSSVKALSPHLAFLASWESSAS
jgi:DNA-binding SARP family transcriptional activator